MEKYIISANTSIKETLKIMDRVASKVLFVQSDNQLVGAISDGDIRRSILKEVKLNIPISKVMNPRPSYVKENYEIRNVKSLMLEKKYEAVPVINEEYKIIKILFWNEIFGESKGHFKLLSSPVVIMAGGKGTRLDPFTRILPKPLIPIDNQPIIEIIMDEFSKYGMNKFYVSVNYKSKMIKAYFEDFSTEYKISYIEEVKPLGTAGALKFLSDIIHAPFFVSNCDIIIKDDYSRIYEFHQKGKFDLTLVASMQHHTIPYGVCEITNGGKLKSIKEKPEYDFLVNTGMYIINPAVLDIIPSNKLYHITDLIGDMQKQKRSIGVYPVSEKSWIDIGQWEEYKNAVDRISKFLIE